jgi:integrase
MSIEQRNDNFYGYKRLNSKLGVFPLFEARFKRKLAATTKAEALAEDEVLLARIDQLQAVCLKDSKGHRLSIRDMNEAAVTWLDVIASFDIDRARKLSKRNTLEAKEANEALAHYTYAVVDHFAQHGQSRGASSIASVPLSTFGDHLYRFLNDGVLETNFSDAVPIYLKQTNRSHLPEDHKAVRDTNRPVAMWLDIVGDKALADISRRNVDSYVAARLKAVKTTSVEREITTLRAVWHKAALVGDLRQQNPFAETSIHGLGLDSERRYTPTAKEVAAILEAMEAKYLVTPSYVSCLIAVAALTGARLSEVWGLEQKDLEGDTLFIRPNETRGSLKTKNSTRPFPVIPPLSVWLERFFLLDKPSSANSASAACNKTLKTLSPLYVVHGLRHGFKQLLSDVDAPLNIIEELQGWSSQRMSASYGKNTARASKTVFVQAVYSLLTPIDAKKTNVIKLKRVKG